MKTHLNVQKNITWLEQMGYIVMTKIELDRIIKEVKLGKTIVRDKNGKPKGFLEV